MNLKTARFELLADLVRPKFVTWHRRCLEAGFPLLVVRTWSSPEEQLALWRQGRTYDPATGWQVVDKLKVVTQTLASAHMVQTVDGRPAALATDVIPLDAAGVPLWPQPKETAEQLAARWLAAFKKPEADCWRAIWDLGAKCGLDALGDPWGAYLRYDLGHLEEPGWRLVVGSGGLHLPTVDEVAHV